MKVAFVGCCACAVISMASERDVLFATQYYGTMIALSAFMFFSNISWFCVEMMARFLHTSGYCDAGFKCQLVTLHSHDAQVPHLFQWLFLAFGMELLLEAFSVREGLIDYYASHNICKNLPFVKDSVYKPLILFQP